MKQKDIKDKTNSLVDKIINARTIKQIRKYGRELEDYTEKFFLLHKAKRKEREERLAYVVSNLAQTKNVFEFYEINGIKPPKNTYNDLESCLEKAKEFDYLPTIRTLSDILKQYKRK